MSYTYVDFCGNDHAEWLNSIDFYDEEFEIIEERLLEIATKYTGHEVMAQVEHFQNQFVVQHNNIDELKHRIHSHNQKVAEDAKLHRGKMETVYVDDHNRLKDQLVSFEKNANELRHEFNLFLSKWM
jgi:NAD-dependent SIR2 family protein deacetylase